jgi:hypothetical protein
MLVAFARSRKSRLAWASAPECTLSARAWVTVHQRGTVRPVTRYVRVLTFVPYFIVVALLVVVAMKVGWGFFLVFLAVLLAASLLFTAWLRRRYRNRA